MGDRAFDFARVPGPIPQEIKDNNGEGVLTYSFRGQSQQYLESIRAAGLKSVWIWERNTDSIFNGYDYAVNECRLHEANAKPGELTYVACDTNDGGVGGRQLLPFLQGWSDTTREPTFGVYGSSGAIRQAQAFGGKCQRYWGVVNWINGGGPNNAPQNIDYWRNAGAHLIQLIGSPIPGTDENLIFKPDWATIDGTEEFSMAQMDTLAQWEQDTRKVILDFLVGDERTKGVLGVWMQEQSAAVIREVNLHIDEMVAGLPQVEAAGMNEDRMREIVREELDKTKLASP